MKFDPLRLGFLALLLSLVPLSGCGDDDDNMTGTGGSGGGGGGGGGGSNITVPAAWAGSWQITGTSTTRGGDVSVNVLSLCSGVAAVDVFIDADDLAQFGVTDLERSCSGTWTDSAINVTCTGTATITDSKIGTCMATITTTVNATRSGGTFDGTSTFTLVFTGNECNFPSTEMESETISAELLNDGATICDASALDVIPASWGGVWDISESEQGGNGRSARGGVLLCPGESANQGFFDGNISLDEELEAGFTDTAAQLTGRYFPFSFPCNEDVTITYDLTRNGDSITGTRTEIRVYSGEPPCELDGQVDITVYDVMGTRTSTDTGACN